MSLCKPILVFILRGLDSIKIIRDSEKREIITQKDLSALTLVLTIKIKLRNVCN
jgi:hypothetical protein